MIRSHIDYDPFQDATVKTYINKLENNRHESEIQKITKDFIDEGGNIDYRGGGRTILQRLIRINCPYAIRELYRYGADMDMTYIEYSNSPLHHAIMEYRKKCVEILLECGADPFKELFWSGYGNAIMYAKYIIERDMSHDKNPTRIQLMQDIVELLESWQATRRESKPAGKRR